MNPIALSAFTDNYIWMFHDGAYAVVLAAILVMQAPGAGDAPPKRLYSTDRKRWLGSFSRRDETSAAQAARSHGAASDEPVAVLAALRQWKNDFR